MSDVVITGFGATTPLGPDAPTTWQGLLEGRNGVHTLDFDWIDDVPVKFAAPAVDDPRNHLPRPQARRLDRSSQLALVAAKEAWADAGLELPEPDDDSGSNGIDPERLVVCCATGIGGLDRWAQRHLGVHQRQRHPLTAMGADHRDQPP